MKVVYFFRVGADIEICKRVKDDIEGWSNVIEVGVLPLTLPDVLADAMTVILHDRYANHVSSSFLVDGLTLSILLAVQGSRTVTITKTKE